MKRSIVAFAIVLAACATAVPLGGDEAGVRAAMTGFMDALNALDVDRMSSYFADDITAFVPLAQADRVQGRAAVTEIFRRFVERTKPNTPRLSLTMQDEECVVSGDLAFISFNIRETGVTRRRTFAFTRSGDRWLIRHFHASDFLLRQ